MRVIRKISSGYSAGVELELENQKKYAGNPSSLLDIRSAESYVSSAGKTGPKHYPKLLAQLPAGSRILDVGVGSGHSSVCAALAGMRIVSVEPSAIGCQNLNFIANRFNLDIQVCEGVAEDISHLSDRDFDAVFFNASLHHCDDPESALRQCVEKLRPGGHVFLVNENFLRPWKRKAWYYRMLDEDPVAVGHYGGNEHVYYNWEYLRLLRRSGLSNVKTVVPTLQLPIERLEFLVAGRVGDKRVVTSALSVALRAVYYTLERRVYQSNALFKLLAACSIVPSHFSGQRLG